MDETVPPAGQDSVLTSQMTATAMIASQMSHLPPSLISPAMTTAMSSSFNDEIYPALGELNQLDTILFSFDLVRSINFINACSNIPDLHLVRQNLNILLSTLIGKMNSNSLPPNFDNTIMANLHNASIAINDRINNLFLESCTSNVLKTIAENHSSSNLATSPAEGMDFQVVKGKKRKNNRHSSPVEQIPLKNKYGRLETEETSANNEEMDESESNINENDTPKIKKGPPIFVANVSNPKTLLKDLSSIAGVPIFGQMNKKDLKISPPSPEIHKLIKNHLSLMKLQSHSFPLKEDRQLKIVIKGLDVNFSIEELKAELQEYEFPVISISQMPDRSNKDSHKKRFLPIFIVYLTKTPESKEIHNLKYISNIKIRVEPLRPRHSPAQCFRCQLFNHSSLFCTRDPVCVKCAEKHLSYQCTKRRTDPPKCANCGDDHTANYTGCPKNPLNQSPAQPPKRNIWIERMERQKELQMNNNAMKPSNEESIPPPPASQVNSTLLSSPNINQDIPPTEFNNPLSSSLFNNGLASKFQETVDIAKNFITIWNSSDSLVTKITFAVQALEKVLSIWK